VAADLIGNGRIDLAITGTGNNTVAILLNHGNGTFTLPIGYPVGTAPMGLTVGDFNLDGSLDLAVANNKSNNISVLTGNGNGTFNAAVNYPAAAGPLSVAADDFNGDGKVDLAVGFSGIGVGASNGVSVLAGNGDGTFQTHVDHASKFLSGAPTEPVVNADFNGDGAVDLLLADQLSGIVTVFLNSALASPAPNALNFGSVTVGGHSNPKTVTLTNSGSASLNVTGVSTSGDYSQTNTCTAPVPAGGTCSISVIFSPTQQGKRPGTLTITDNSPSGSQKVTLAGTGK
jgi:hypothetical protein